ncbi:hypothetical protein ES708_34323 [subsurface metagenome]
MKRLSAKIVTGYRAFLSDDKAVDPDFSRFKVLLVYAVVADKGIGGHQNLAGIGRVGEHFLVAYHAGVEDDLAVGVGLTSEAVAFIGRAIGQDQYCSFSHF